MALIDWHTHLWSVDHHLTERAEHQLNRIGEMDLDATTERYRRDVTEQTEGSVLVGSYWPKVGITVPNEDLSTYIRGTDTPVYGLASIDPSKSGAGLAAEHAIRDLGLHGFKLAPTYQGFHPWCQEARDVYEVAETYNVPIMYHQGAAFAAESLLEDARPALLDKVARDHPRLKLIVAHLGQPWCEEVIQLMRKHPNVWTDASARYTRAWQMFNALTVAVEYRVQDRILFGSDFPTQTPREAEASFLKSRDEYVPRYFPQRVGDIVEDVLYNRPLSAIFGAEPRTT
jgi:predicted TIM-barrel fold metal-dependent hydrolase